MPHDPSAKPVDYLIDAVELQSILGSGTVRLFDATVLFSAQPDGTLAARSGIDAYREAHIPSAAFFDHLGQFADPDSTLRNTLLGINELQSAIGEAGIGPDDLVVVYSSQFLMWATRAWWMLHYAGHSNVRVLNGGLAAWQAAGFPTETGEHQYPPTLFSAIPRLERYVTKDEINAAIGSAACTIDALPSDLYEGTSNRHYGRPGHIPGAINLPNHQLQNEQAYKPVSEIRSALAQRGLLDAPQVYAYCGGGIAATVDALACLLCGQQAVAVYDGSMSEWSRDPHAPLKTGAEP